ncbi:transcription factor IIA alpha/beta subunit [Mycena pura]|uniref:Transcription factor IIA alpha/beta subunit n=1 Tax=Mycena pura TaxID=153505 RepID=A0AAD7E4W2_9AGAR|nr:transcription factor IIA alpha/beta subunit [Mycena pura]
MSNKIVPEIYRVVIDDVVGSIRPAFEEFGVAEEILQEPPQKWETKVLASRVADFAIPAAPALSGPPHQHAHPVQHYPAYMPPNSGPPRPPVKAEPFDPRYALAAAQYRLPPLPGPMLPPHLAFPATAGAPATQRPPLPAALPLFRVPQVDGPSASDDEDDEDEDAGPAFAPRAAHPSLPQPAAAKVGGNGVPAGEEAINSDLDDSDTENEEDEEDAGPETDIVFCTYDKVARVKNKWKCVLKDGMIHTGGKDFLFMRCTG